MLSRTFLFCLYLVGHVEASNILGVFTLHSPSHNIIHMSTIAALVDAGHNVTVVTRIPPSDTSSKYHLIHIPFTPEDKQRLDDLYKSVATSKSRIRSYRGGLAIMKLMNEIEQKSLLEPAFQELLHNKGNHFDLMIMGFGFNDYLYGIADHFKCPLIVSWVNTPLGSINELVGNPEGPSYIPSIVFGNQRMGFFKRVANLLLSEISGVVMKIGDRQVAKYYERHFPAERGYRSMGEMRKNVSLVFCSTFFSEGIVRPYAPNFIEIGGIQAKDKPGSLPKDIAEFLDTADDGVIYFSLGSNFKSAVFDENAIEVIFKVLSARKEKVLWKWDTPEGPGRADNIMYKQWLPQDDILVHPKVKLFITHGGKGSITEAQYHGVPMLSLPVFGDQFTNSIIMQSQGYGVYLDHHTMTEDEFRMQLQEVLYNSTYYDAVKQYSKLYRDRPMTPRQSVVYWSEYVIRHRGAKHMQSPRVHLNFWQYNCLDVFGCLLAVLCIVFLITKRVVRYAIKLLCHRSRSYLKKKKI